MEGDGTVCGQEPDDDDGCEWWRRWCYVTEVFTHVDGLAVGACLSTASCISDAYAF